MIALFAVLAHLAFLRLLPARWRVNQSADYFLFYEPVARNIAAGNGLIAPDGGPALQYPPGFPVFLVAAFKASDILGLSENLVLHIEIIVTTALTGTLVYLIAEHVFGWWVGIVAAFLWSTYPLQLWLTKQPDSGQTFGLFLLLSIYLFLLATDQAQWCHPMMFSIGILVGLESLIRPIGVGLILVFLAALWRLRPARGLKRLAVPVMLLVSGNLIAVLPWEVWARQASGQWIPLSTNGPASMFDGFTLSAARQPLDLPLPSRVRGIIHHYVANIRILNSSGKLISFTLSEGIHDPAGMLELAAIKAARTWYATDNRQLENGVAAVQAFYLFLGLWGIRSARKQKPSQAAFVFQVSLFTAYFWSMSMMTLSIVRYMVPVMTLILILAAAGVGDLCFRRETKQSYSAQLK